MSLTIQDKSRLKVGKIVEVKDNYAVVHFTSTEKNKQTGKWDYSDWSFARVVWNAFEKMKAEGLSVGDVIETAGAKVTFAKYTDANGEKHYPKNPQLVVFDYEIHRKSGKPDESVTVNEDEFPF